MRTSGDGPDTGKGISGADTSRVHRLEVADCDLKDFAVIRSLERKTRSAVIEPDSATGLYVGFVPGFPGAHSQGGTLDELQHNLQEVIAMLMEGHQCHRDGYC